MLDIERIIHEGRICPVFQPIIALKTRSVIGFEALCRATDSDGKPVPPLGLFAEARRQGISLKLDRACRKAALGAFAALHPDDDNVLFLNIESSAINDSVTCSRYLLTQCEQAGISPERVALELVETEVQSENYLVNFVEAYRGEGFTIAIDDVGDGYSSLNRIALVKPDIIKADRSLLSGIHGDYMKQRIVESLAVLSRNIGALFLVEGVETKEEALAAYRLGAELFQGFWFARPGDGSPAAFAGHEGRVSDLALSAREASITYLGRRQSRVADCFAHMETVAELLAQCEEEDFDECLSAFDGKLSRCECLYVIDKGGIQVTRTALLSNFPSDTRLHTIFKPAPRGSDHSLKEYFFRAETTRRHYVSEPYVSYSSGRVCFTISAPFTPRGAKALYFLCADFAEDERIG